ncbi:hypothetical protein POKO110462_15395 [Pontibacter korlensis]|uniref:Lipoprotein n=1 Tax=Pontibacter korlensis TaxID=400092 RepID=A0A0E3ZF34_9BACT|nr:hypothetical protein [Pontibacter korlensis]AKD04109.1 hypothetical protein PKOR_14680 [Pontibacter korlensis]
MTNLRQKLLHFTVLGFVAISASCSKNEEGNPTITTVDARLIYTGDYAVDGCGYVLQMGDVRHKPVNESEISDSFKTKTPTEVETKIINYNKTTRACMSMTDINTIKILEIRRK